MNKWDLEPRHILHKLILHGEQFPDKSQRLAERFALEYCLEKDPAFDLETLRAMESRALEHAENKEIKELIKPEFVSGIIAFIGINILHIKGGHWKMILAFDKETWVPWIIDNANKWYCIGDIISSFYEDEHSFSLPMAIYQVVNFPFSSPEKIKRVPNFGEEEILSL